MLLESLALLVGFASVFAVTAGLARDSKFLVPMAGILLLASGALLTSGSLEVQEGFYEETFQNMTSNSTTVTSPNGHDEEINVSSNTDTFTERTPIYSNLDTQYSLGPLNLSGSLAFVFLAISLYSFILAYQRKR